MTDGNVAPASPNSIRSALRRCALASRRDWLIVGVSAVVGAVACVSLVAFWAMFPDRGHAQLFLQCLFVGLHAVAALGFLAVSRLDLRRGREADAARFRSASGSMVVTGLFMLTLDVVFRAVFLPFGPGFLAMAVCCRIVLVTAELVFPAYDGPMVGVGGPTPPVAA